MGTSFSKRRKNALKKIANPRTDPVVKEVLESEILGYCKGCAEDKKKVNATHDRFGTPLCEKCNDVVQQKLDVMREENEARDSISEEDEE